MLASIWPVRALMISATVRTVQMLARWAANPRIIASETARTRIAMLHPASVPIPKFGPRVTLYERAAGRFMIVLSGYRHLARFHPRRRGGDNGRQHPGTRGQPRQSPARREEKRRAASDRSGAARRWRAGRVPGRGLSCAARAPHRTRLDHRDLDRRDQC